MLATLPLWGQATPDVPTVRITKTTRLVSIDVVAKDKNGHAVSNLEAQDFTIRDNGIVQKVGRFSVEHGVSEEKAAEETATQESTPSHHTVFSNSHPSNLSAVVILMDTLNTPIEDQSLMKSQLLRSLAEMKSPPPTALLHLSNELRVLSDFTSSTASLMQALKDFQATRAPGVGPTLAAPVTPNLKANLAIARTNEATLPILHAEGSRRTLAILNLIRQHVDRIKGKKSLIWISGGLVLPFADIPRLEELVDSFNNDNISVYTVNARGLEIGPGIDASGGLTDMNAPTMSDDTNPEQGVLDTVAHSTGGMAYRNGNGLSTAIAQAIEDTTVVYTLSYYPAHNKWDGSYHKLDVRANQPGVHLRCRSGYLASPEPKLSADERQNKLLEVAKSPLDYPGIRFTVTLTPGSNPGSANLLLHVTGDDLSLVPKDGKQVDVLQIWFIQRNSAGDDLLVSAVNRDLSFSPAVYRGFLKEGLSLASPLKLDSAAARIRVVLRDSGSEQIGTVDVPLDPVAHNAPAPKP